MSLVKLAAQQKQEGGIAGWTKRHPLMAAGVALTGGIAASDAVLHAVEHGIKSPGLGKAVKTGLWKGGLYGGVLSATEPLILHGALKKPVEKD